jgi:hypothetical protein
MPRSGNALAMHETRSNPRTAATQLGCVLLECLAERLRLSIWQTPSGRSRRWVKRKDTNIPAPLYARLTILALLVVLAGTLAWYGLRAAVHRATHSEAPRIAQTASLAHLAANNTPAWQSDALASIENGIHQAQSGNITAAEVAMDRAGSMIESARVAAQSAPPDFFETASRSLDTALQTHPENTRLFEHITTARVDLAQLRSAEAVAPASGAEGTARTGVASTSSQPIAGATDNSARGPLTEKVLTIASPREIAANHLLGPTELGGDTIDATLMPETIEILLPPSSRLFIDNVRVHDITLKGAAQTLDGIHWKNVTFVGTRLRYESGELDLQNVHFLGCTFGLPMDPRGARLANAIALGQASLTIVE